MPRLTVRRLRVAWPVIILWALVLGGFLSATSPPIPAYEGFFISNFDVRLKDVQLFSVAGDAILHGDFAAAYANPLNQASPLQLVADALIVSLAQYVAYPFSWLFIQAVVCAGVLAVAGGLIRAVTMQVSARNGDASPESRRSPRHRLLGMLDDRWLPLAGMLLLALWSVPVAVYTSGHWWQMLVFLGWIVGGVLAWRDKPAWAGLVIAAGVAWEPWAVFGTIFILWARSWRSAFLFAASFAAVAAAVWLPFAIQPGFALTEFAWSIRPDSAWAWILEPGSPFPWHLRVMQTLIIAGAASVAAWLARRHLGGAPGARSPGLGMNAWWWATWVSAIVVSARISTDVWFGQYYFAPLLLAQVALMAGLIVGGATPLVSRAMVMLASIVVVFALPEVWGPFAAAMVALVFVFLVGTVPLTGRALSRIPCAQAGASRSQGSRDP